MTSTTLDWKPNSYFINCVEDQPESCECIGFSQDLVDAVGQLFNFTVKTEKVNLHFPTPVI